MKYYKSIRIIKIVLITVMLSTSNISFANELTDVVDAFDGRDPFDINFDLSYKLYAKEATVTREEWNYLKKSIRNVRQRDYSEFGHQVIIKSRMGLYKDLELGLEIPYQITGSYKNTYANGVTDQDSNMLVRDNKIFDEPISPLDLERKGLGDIKINLSWALLNDYRDDTVGTWIFRITYKAPTGTERIPIKFSNTRETKSCMNSLAKDCQIPASPTKDAPGGIGLNYHKVTFETAFSKRLRKLEPYISISYSLPFTTSGSSKNKRCSPLTAPKDQEVEGDEPFYERYRNHFTQWRTDEDKCDVNSSYIDPGHELYLISGLEIIPWEDTSKHKKISIDLRVHALYKTDGRDHSEVSDLFNELTWVEEHSNIGASLGFHFRAAENASFRFYIDGGFETPHLITSERTGEDNGLDGPMQDEETDTVYEFSPGRIDSHTEEVNPDYNDLIDQVGRRFGVSKSWYANLMVTGTLNF